MANSERRNSARPRAALRVEKLERRDLPDATGSTVFVTQAYHDLLKRDPDPGGLALYSGALNQGSLTRGQVALAIETSPEFRGDEVRALYAAYLHRPADPAGLAGFTWGLLHGSTVEQAAASLFGSPEYYQDRGAGSPDGFLDALYADVLGRPIDVGARTFLEQALANGSTRTQVAGYVLRGGEYQQVLVEKIYQQYLGHAADPAGLAADTAFLARGGQDEYLIAALVGSAEYYSRLNIPSDPPATDPTLTPGDVQTLLQRAAAAAANDSAIVAVVDRQGHILGVSVESGVSTAITANTTNLVFAIDGAVALARTGAFFSSNQGPITSRTVEFISQSTTTQREVDANPDLTDLNLPFYGPGLVAPIRVGGHFPPGVPFTPPVDLYDIELTNRDTTSGITGTRFNVPSQYIPAGQGLAAPESYGVISGKLSSAQSRGIGTLPGGLPIYKNGTLVGGIGVFFPGTTGFASAENSSLSSNYDPTRPDLSAEAEYIAFAALGGSSGAGYTFGALGGIAPLPGFDLPFGRIDLQGITLPVYGPGGIQGPQNLVNFGRTLGTGSAAAAHFQPVDAANHLFLAGQDAPSGWLVLPHAGGGLTAADVEQMVQQGIARANVTDSAIRVLQNTAHMVFAVSDLQGDVLGLYRMSDAPIFSEAVAVAKARNDAYYDDPGQLQPQDQVPGVAPGVAFTARTFRYLAQPRYPEGIDGQPPGPFSILNDGGTNPVTGLNTGAPLPASAFQSVEGYAAFHPTANFHDPNNPANQNGVVFFPGSSPLYKGPAVLVGGLGVSGDGVDEDDVVTVAAAAGFAAPPSVTRADQVTVRGVRLPYQEFDRNPQGT